MKTEESIFRACLSSFEKLKCWGVVAGAGTGSRVSLALGEKIKRSKTVDNPHISVDLQNFDAEFSIFIEDAAWRLETAESVICSWLDNNHAGGPMVEGLAGLVGNAIIRAEFNTPSYDLNIFFEGSLVLRLFCCSCLEEGVNNYTLFVPSKYVSVGSLSKLEVSDRKKPNSARQPQH